MGELYDANITEGEILLLWLLFRNILAMGRDLKCLLYLDIFMIMILLIRHFCHKTNKKKQLLIIALGLTDAN